MKKLRNSITVLSFCLFVSNSFSQSWEWAIGSGGELSNVGNDILVDKSGNIFTTGLFTGTATFGNHIVVSKNKIDSDIFLAKQDPDGNYLWIKTMGSVATDYAYGIASDNNGNIYIGGVISEPLSFYLNQSEDTLEANADLHADLNLDPNSYFGDTAVTSKGGFDMVLAKFDVNGNFKWVRTIGSTEDDEIFAISVDKENNIIVAGYSGGNNVPFGASYEEGHGDKDICIAKFKPDGSLLWGKLIGAEGFDAAAEVTTDEKNNIYVTGRFHNTVDFGGQILSADDKTSFVAKYTKSGQLIWSQKIENYQTRDIAVNNEGVYVTGTSFETYSQKAFVAQYTLNGSFNWLKNYTEMPVSVSNEIAISSNNEIYLTGYANEYKNIEGSSLHDSILNLSLNDQIHTFIWKLNKFGEPVYKARSTNSGISNTGLGLALDNKGGVYISGMTYLSPLLFGMNTVISKGQMALFTAKYSEFTTPLFFAPSLSNEKEFAFEIESNYADGTSSYRVDVKRELSSGFSEKPFIFGPELFDLSGRNVTNNRNLTSIGSTILINLNELPHGIYFISAYAKSKNGEVYVVSFKLTN